MKFSKFFVIVSSLAIMSPSAQAVLAQIQTQSQSQAETVATETTDKTSPAYKASISSVAEGHRPRIGLALGGGGARGAAHVGVLKVLEEEGVPIDMIAGTSIGAVVGGLYAAGVPTDELAEDFEDSKLMKEFMTVPITVRILLAPILFTPRLLGAHPYDGLYRGIRFRKYVNSLAPKSDTELADLHIPFAAICTNVVDGKSYRISKGNLGIALQASTAVPGLRKPVQIGDKLYCDGGLVCNLPVSHVKEMGADFVIAVNIDEHLKDTPLNSFREPGSISKQALRIQLASIDKAQSKEADMVIHPDTDGITLISRKASDGRKGVDSGIEAARAAMPELKRKLAALGIQLSSKKQSSAGLQTQ